MKSTAMYLMERHPWITAYIQALSFAVYSLITGHESIDPGAQVFWIFLLVVGSLVFLVFVSVIWALIWIPHRFLRPEQTLPPGTSYLLIMRLMLLFLVIAYGWRTWLVTNPSQVRQAKAYVAKAAPELERYYDEHNHYPDSLRELGLAESAPWGLTYKSISGSNEWPSNSREHGSYTFLVGDLWYYNGSWQFGGL